ncbi:hypothetical protein MMC32_006676 [Xylographa parallela]|nr:hypothetical protein [Xylographa parallela]
MSGPYALKQAIQFSRDDGRPVLKPMPPPIPTRTELVWPSQNPPNPEQPCMTDYQLRLNTCFEFRGYFGLAVELYHYAREMVARPDCTRVSSWNLIIDDWENKEYQAYMLLCTLPPAVICSMILNNIAVQRHSFGPDDQRFYRQNMLPSSNPGIYMNIPCYGKTGDPDWEYEGRFLCQNDVVKLSDAIQSYVVDSATTNRDSIAFDELSPPGINSQLAAICADPEARRYAPSDRALEIMRDWAISLKESYCRGTDLTTSATANVPFQRAPMEVGWAENVEQHLKQQADGDPTSYVSGYVNCWTQKVMKPTGNLGSFGPPLQLTLFRVWSVANKLPQIAEVVASMSCSSHVEQGGYNVTDAGTFGNIPEDLQGLAANERALLGNNGVWRVPDALLHDWKKNKEKQAVFESLKQIDAGEREILASKQRVMKMEAERLQIEAKLAGLRKKAQEEKDQAQAAMEAHDRSMNDVEKELVRLFQKLASEHQEEQRFKKLASESLDDPTVLDALSPEDRSHVQAQLDEWERWDAESVDLAHSDDSVSVTSTEIDRIMAEFELQEKEAYDDEHLVNALSNTDENP